jgi:dTDP-4-dehydrorhamnose reductase
MIKNRVLILGSSGLIGHQIYNHLFDDKKYTLYNLARKNKLKNDTILLNARDEKNIVNEINRIKPQFIINCIGILISGSNEDPENAIFLNAYMPHMLSRLADRIDAKLIHISTDCVFSGEKKIPYTETDIKDGKDIYAKSKGLGEVINNRHLTIRTSVVGPELKQNGEELFHWFMTQQEEISGYTKAIWSGVTSLELAKAVKWAIENKVTGLYQVTNNSSINKFDLLKLFKKHTKKNINIKQVDGKDIDKSFTDTRLLINYTIPSYDEMVADMVKSINNNPSLYSQYI